MKEEQEKSEQEEIPDEYAWATLLKCNEGLSEEIQELKADVKEARNAALSEAINKLPEAMEIQYHARVLDSEQFREYWNEILEGLKIKP